MKKMYSWKKRKEWINERMNEETKIDRKVKKWTKKPNEEQKGKKN